ncbi:hypothetical protein WMY93_014750 [Mugilogobius chulae]|uniref:Coiled-coil domain-containing protein 171-like n=1 Tax=Mugilogobius chulae TaxID=88201 RepID=A0AAW0NVE8_9GOBI
MILLNFTCWVETSLEMRSEAAGRGRESGRGRRAESARSSAQPRETPQRSKSSGEMTRDNGAEGGKRKEKRVILKGEPAEDVGRELRWKMNHLEKEKLQLTSAHNQQVCSLEAELARLRASVERSEAERAELEFQITVCLREKEKEAQSNRDLQRERHTLTERQAELEQSLSDLRVALDRTLSGREQDQRNLQQELEERDGLIQRLSEDNSQLHSLLTDQKQALEQSEQRMKELQREIEREQELKRRQADQLRYLSNREKRYRADKEFAEQRIKTLETNIETERAAHLESKFNSEIVQLRLRDLEAALAVEQSNLQEATCSTEQLKEHLQEAERKREEEQQRSSHSQAQLHSLQLEFDQCKSDLSTEKRLTSDLKVALESEKRMTSCLKEQMEEEQRKLEITVGTQEALHKFSQDVKDTLQQHLAEDSGSWSPDDTVKKLKMTLCSHKQRQEEANKQIKDLLFASEQLLDDNQALKNLSSQQKTQIEETQQLLEEQKREVTRLQTEGCDWSSLSRQLQTELHRERDERKRERDKMEEQLRVIKQQQREQEESLHEPFYYITLLLIAPQWAHIKLITPSVMLLFPAGEGSFVLNALPPSASPAQSIMGTLSWDELWLRICERVEQINADMHQSKQQVSSLQGVLSRLEGKMRKREAELSHKHQQAVTELQRHLQSSRAECYSLQDRVTSLTSDLSSLSHESGRFRWACVLLGGALAHAQTRLQRLSEQKAFLCRWMSKRDALVQEVSSLVEALEADEDDAQLQKKKSARRRWRRVLTVVTTLRRWCMLGKQATCCSSSQSVLSAAQSGMSLLLGNLLDQSDAATVTHNCPLRRPTLQPHMKELVSSLQQHFLDFSQRLHSTEVERRSLRQELNNLKRAMKKREQEVNKMVPCERFATVCSELQEALCREQEAQGLVQELNSQLNQLQTNMDSYNTRTTEAQAAHDQTTQLLSDARREVCRKERSLRILGKHLTVVQKEKRQLEERLREAQEELLNSTKHKEQLIEMMRTAERNCTEFRESFSQSHCTLSSKPRPLVLLESKNKGESIMGDPDVEACQSLLSSVALLSQTFSSRADWLQQEVSAHQSHVTALRSELQDACLRHNQAFTPIAVPFIDIESTQPLPVGDLLKNVTII